MILQNLADVQTPAEIIGDFEVRSGFLESIVL
jgi:hypothetical protein